MQHCLHWCSNVCWSITVHWLRQLALACSAQALAGHPSFDGHHLISTQVALHSLLDESATAFVHTPRTCTMICNPAHFAGDETLRVNEAEEHQRSCRPDLTPAQSCQLTRSPNRSEKLQTKQKNGLKRQMLMNKLFMRLPHVQQSFAALAGRCWCSR